ncbi:hypothetical protein A2U01_0085964, partial [Trifolium medium]|nr:hypothetical protein [Trifolium medium]
TKKDGAGQVVIGPQGAPVEEEYAKFSFKWIKDYYLLESKHFTFKRFELGPDEVADYDKLVAFVATFPTNLWEDSDGNLLMATDGC